MYIDGWSYNYLSLNLSSCLPLNVGYVRGMSQTDADSLGADIRDFGYVETEFFIVLAVGKKLKNGEWKVSKYVVYDGNTRLLAVRDIPDVTVLPCMVVYTTDGISFFYSLHYPY